MGSDAGAGPQLAELAALGHALEAAAASGDWTEAHALDTRRCAVLRALGHTCGRSDPGAVRDALAEALALTARVSATAARARDQGELRLVDIKRGNRAARAYLAAASGG